jgi:aspartate-semialdehyde dehydrogenase
MLKVGFVGWRGMVGSVLMQRMMHENDFAEIEPQFFTTSQVGDVAPNVGKESPALKNAKDVNSLKAMDVIVSC